MRALEDVLQVARQPVRYVDRGAREPRRRSPSSTRGSGSLSRAAAAAISGWVSASAAEPSSPEPRCRRRRAP
jgi:hypothetical protein